MGGTISRESYLDTGLSVLSDLGYGGLKLAEVCNRLGVTTGSFYHHFSSWSAFGEELLAHWVRTRTSSIASSVRTESDPRRRIDMLVQEALMLPYSAESAIRVWGSIDAAVYAVQAEVDRQRYDILFEAALEILIDDVQAQRFATTAMYLLIGCEQATLARVPDDLRWIADVLVGALNRGTFAIMPGAG